jgi:hypothetical protein
MTRLLGFQGARRACKRDGRSRLWTRRVLWGLCNAGSAQYSYFPQLLSVISIPDPDEQLRKAVDSVWDMVEMVDTLDELRYERKKAKVKTALDDLKDDIVLAEIKRRRAGADKPWKPIKQAEIEMLLSAGEEIGDDTPEGDFYARRLKSDNYPKWLSAKLSRVVRVDRLKEVVAQVGFTRFEAASPTIDELDVNVKRAELATDVAWLPAVENRGEGIVLGFRPEIIADWLKRQQLTERGTTLLAGFNAWRRSHSGSVSGSSLHTAPLLVSFANHRRVIGVRLFRVLDSRADLRRRIWIRHPALYCHSGR